MSVRVAASVKFDYDTKVFKKELVKFADTEEYIYRWVHNVARFFRVFFSHCGTFLKNTVICGMVEVYFKECALYDGRGGLTFLICMQGWP